MKIKILIIRFSSIGDIVLTSPVVRCINTQIQNPEIHFVTKERFACVVNSNPHIKKVHVLKESFSDLVSELKNEKFDYVVDLHRNIRSSRIKNQLKSSSFSFDKLNLKKLFYVQFKINRLPDIHIVDRYISTLKELKVTNDNKGLEYFIPKEEVFKNSDLPSTFQKGYLAFVIAGTYFTKKFPVEKIAAISNSIEYPVLLLGGKTETEEGDAIVRLSKGNVLNYAGKVSLNQSASLVEGANLVISNDTGLMHIAAAFKKKILSVWGNTTPQLGMYPYMPNKASKIIEIEGLKCRPCSKLGKHKCPKKHFNCMHLIKNEEIISWIKTNFDS